MSPPPSPPFRSVHLHKFGFEHTQFDRRQGVLGDLQTPFFASQSFQRDAFHFSVLYLGLPLPKCACYGCLSSVAVFFIMDNHSSQFDGLGLSALRPHFRRGQWLSGLGSMGPDDETKNTRGGVGDEETAVLVWTLCPPMRVTLGSPFTDSSFRFLI